MLKIYTILKTTKFPTDALISSYMDLYNISQEEHSGSESIIQKCLLASAANSEMSSNDLSNSTLNRILRSHPNKDKHNIGIIKKCFIFLIKLTFHKEIVFFYNIQNFMFYIFTHIVIFFYTHLLQRTVINESDSISFIFDSSTSITRI